MAVLAGDVGAIGTVQLGETLESQGLDGDHGSFVTPGETEVVLIEPGLPRSRGTVGQGAAGRPDVRVIVCSLDEATMFVYPGGGALPYEAPFDPPRVAATIRQRP